MIYVTDCTWIIYRSEEMIDEWMYGNPGDVVLDSTRGDKNEGNAIMVFDSNGGSNKAIFE